jgi:hypothetical protein
MKSSCLWFTSFAISIFLWTGWELPSTFLTVYHSLE